MGEILISGGTTDTLADATPLPGDTRSRSCDSEARSCADTEVGMAGTRVVVVDDDDLFRESIERNLTDAGFDVSSFARGSDLLEHLGNQGSADLVILDWKMPGMNGIEVLRQMRAARIVTPAIFLTALTDQIYEEAAFTSGAVDFVEKSRSFAILLKRIELILGGVKTQGQPSQAGSEDVVRLGDLELRLDAHRALWKGHRVDLTLAEFRVVSELVAHGGGDLDYRSIYDIVRGKGFVAGAGAEGYRANVRTFVKRVRQKFRDVDESFDQIQNFPGYGYRWCE